MPFAQCQNLVFITPLKIILGHTIFAGSINLDTGGKLEGIGDLRVGGELNVKGDAMFSSSMVAAGSVTGGGPYMDSSGRIRRNVHPFLHGWYRELVAVTAMMMSWKEEYFHDI